MVIIYYTWNDYYIIIILDHNALQKEWLLDDHITLQMESLLDDHYILQIE